MPRKIVSSKTIMLLYIAWASSLPPLAMYILNKIDSMLVLPFAILSIAASFLISFFHTREEKIAHSKKEG